MILKIASIVIVNIIIQFTNKTILPVKKNEKNYVWTKF